MYKHLTKGDSMKNGGGCKAVETGYPGGQSESVGDGKKTKVKKTGWK